MIPLNDTRTVSALASLCEDEIHKTTDTNFKNDLEGLTQSLKLIESLLSLDDEGQEDDQ